VSQASRASFWYASQYHTLSRQHHICYRAFYNTAQSCSDEVSENSSPNEPTELKNERSEVTLVATQEQRGVTPSGAGTSISSQFTMLMEALRQYGSGTLSGNSLSISSSATLDILRLDDDLVWPIASGNMPSHLTLLRHTDMNLLRHILNVGQVDAATMQDFLANHPPQSQQQQQQQPQAQMQDPTGSNGTPASSKLRPALVVTGNRFAWTEMILNGLLLAFLRQGRTVILVDTRCPLPNESNDYVAYEFNVLSGIVTELPSSQVPFLDSASHPATVMLVNVDHPHTSPGSTSIPLPPRLTCPSAFTLYVKPAGLQTDPAGAYTLSDQDHYVLSYAWSWAELLDVQRCLQSPRFNVRSSQSPDLARFTTKDAAERLGLCGGLPQLIFDPRMMKAVVYNQLRETIISSHGKHSQGPHDDDVSHSAVAQGPSALASVLELRSAKQIAHIRDPYLYRLAVIDREPGERISVANLLSFLGRKSQWKSPFHSFNGDHVLVASGSRQAQSSRQGLPIYSAGVVLGEDIFDQLTQFSTFNRRQRGLSSNLVAPAHHPLMSVQTTQEGGISRLDGHVPAPDSVVLDQGAGGLDEMEVLHTLQGLSCESASIRLISQDLTECAMIQWRVKALRDQESQGNLSSADVSALDSIFNQQSMLDPVAFRPLALEHQFLSHLEKHRIGTSLDGASAKVHQIIPLISKRSYTPHSFRLQFPCDMQIEYLKAPVSRSPRPVRELLTTGTRPVLVKPVIRNHYCYDLLYLEPETVATLPSQARPRSSRGRNARSDNNSSGSLNQRKPSYVTLPRPVVYAFKFLPSLRNQTHMMWKRLLEDIAAIEYGSYSIPLAVKFIDRAMEQLEGHQSEGANRVNQNGVHYIDWDSLRTWFTFRFIFVTDSSSPVNFAPPAAAGYLNIHEFVHPRGYEIHTDGHDDLTI